jgi:hypothetical protein
MVMKKSLRPAPSNFRFVVVILLTLLTVAVALLPGAKPNAVLGRWNYLQFYLVVLSGGITLVSFVLLALPPTRRRAVGSSFLFVVLSFEAVAWLLPGDALEEELPGVGILTLIPFQRRLGEAEPEGEINHHHQAQ